MAGVPPLSNQQDPSIMQREALSDHNRNRMTASTISFGFGQEGSDPYMHHRNRTSVSARQPTTHIVRERTREDIKRANNRSQLKFGTYEMRSENCRRGAPQQEKDEQPMEDIRTIRMRRQKLQEEAHMLAMQISRQTSTQRSRVRQINQATSLTISDTDDHEKELARTTIGEAERRKLNEATESARVFSNEYSHRNKRTQIHNMHYGASSSETLREETERKNAARDRPLENLTLDELRTLVASEERDAAKLQRQHRR